MSTVLVTASISNAGKDVIELSYSDNGVNWGFSPVAQKSAAAVSLAAFNNALWATFRGHTSTTLYVSSSANWGVNEHTGQSTKPAPSITVFQNQLWIAYIGEATGRVEVISSVDGKSWVGPNPTGVSSHLAASITEGFQNKLWIAFINETTGQIEVTSSGDGASWSPKPTSTGQSSHLPPAITVFQDQLWIAYTGAATGHVEVISSADGVDWSKSPTSTGASSKLPPAITKFDDELWVAFVGEATGHVEVMSSRGGEAWSTTVNTGQSSRNGPSLAAVPAVQPPDKFGGAVQYVFASPQGDGWPGNTNAKLPPIVNLLLYITVTEELTFDPNSGLSFQLNCCSPPAHEKIGWQQYVLIFEPNSTNMLLHIQNFGPAVGSRAVYAGTKSSQINLPNNGSIPAGWTFQLALQYAGNIVTGASCVVFDKSGKTIGGVSLSSIGLPLALQSGNVDQTWLSPIVDFQLVVVGYSEGAHATVKSGGGFVLCESATPLVAANTWAGSACANGGGGTAESSNCAYSVVPDLGNTGTVQCFGAPPRAGANV